MTDVTTTTAKVTWSEATDNVGVVGYNVYLNEEKVNETLVTTTEYDLTALTEETNYSVKVTAVDAAKMNLRDLKQLHLQHQKHRIPKHHLYRQV